MANYYTLLTPVGLAKVANAQLTQSKVAISHIAVGDSNGTNYPPTGNETALKKEKWRGSISSIAIDTANPNWIVVEAILPATVGGFTLREVALYDEVGDMIAIGNYPDTYKPVASDGSTMDLVLRTIIEVSNADSVTLKIDPNVVVASRKYVDDKMTEHASETMPHAQEGVTYYVRPDGNDNNVGTSNSSVGAFRNVQTAINKLKKYIKGTIKIRILPGDYSSEGQIKVEGFYGQGRLVITAYDGSEDVQNNTNSDSYKIDSLYINNCRNGIDIFSLKSTYNGIDRAGFYAINSSFVFFGWCKDTVSNLNKTGFLFEVGSMGACSGCICENKGVALEVRNSMISSMAWSAGNTPNTVGLKVIQSGVIGKLGIQPNSTIMETTDSGGVIR